MYLYQLSWLKEQLIAIEEYKGTGHFILWLHLNLTYLTIAQGSTRNETASSQLPTYMSSLFLCKR